MLVSLPGLVLVAVTAAAAVTDARSGRIPNVLTVPLVVLVPPLRLALEGAGGLAAAVVGVVACGLVPLLLFLRGAMGGGDVKLLAAIGAVLGWRAGLEVQMAGYLVAAIAVLLRPVSRRRLGWALRRRGGRPPASESSAPVPGEGIRLGVPVFVAHLVWHAAGVLA
jgi:prepilin peptidase CpaA